MKTVLKTLAVLVVLAAAGFFGYRYYQSRQAEMCIRDSPVGRRNLLGLVAQIPLAHEIQKRRKFAAFLFVAVNVVGDSNKMNPILPEHDLGIKAGLQVITTDPTEVFAQQVGHLPGLNVGDQAFPARTLKIAARPSIIRIVDNIGCLLYTSRCV